MTRRLMTLVLALACLTPALAQEQLKERWRGHWPKPELREAESNMATTYTTWTNAAGNYDWNIAANWTAAVPNGNGSQFTAVFDGTVSQSAPRVNLDRSAYVFGVRVLRNYQGSIGEVGNPVKGQFQISVDSSQHIHIQGSGSHHFYQAAYAEPKIFVNAMSSSARRPALTLTGDGGNAKLGILVVTAGCVNIGSNVELVDGTIIIIGQGSYVEILPKETAEVHADYVMLASGGRLVSERATATATRFWIEDNSQLQQTGLIHADNVVHQNGGLFAYTPVTGAASAFTYHGLRGVLDLSGNTAQVMTGTLIRGPMLSVDAGAVDVGGMTWTYDLTEKFP